jgi:hypothetical protein
MTETIRLGCSGELNGYVFTDMAHASEWLRQSFVHDMKEVSLEVVDIGPLMPCPRCQGRGFRQDIKRTGRKLTVEEFLGGSQ